MTGKVAFKHAVLILSPNRNVSPLQVLLRPLSTSGEGSRPDATAKADRPGQVVLLNVSNQSTVRSVLQCIRLVSSSVSGKMALYVYSGLELVAVKCIHLDYDAY